MEFTDEQLERYARHIILREMGGVGQAKLAAAHVLIAGCGGLGVPLVQYLAAAGVGRLTLVDGDHVALANLQRQVAYRSADIGRPKAATLAAAARALNPDIEVEAVDVYLDAATIDALVTSADVVADGTDRFETRLMISDAAVRAERPYVSGALGPTEGQVAIFDPARGPEQPCYRCFLPAPPGGEAERTCSDAGVIGPLAGVIGCLQALEVVKLVADMGEPLVGRMLIFDALDARQRVLTVRRDAACPACGGRS